MSARRGASAVRIRPGTREHESALVDELHAVIGRFISPEDGKNRMRQACVPFLEALASCPGRTCQERWNHFEQAIWPRWIAGDARPPLTHWTAGPRALVLTRRVTPTWDWLADLPVQRWISVLPTSDPWRHAQDRFQSAVALIAWASRCAQEKAVVVGLRMLITRGYARLEQITDHDLAHIPSGARGQDVLDAALCGLGILRRTPQRGTTRRSRRRRATVAESVAMADLAEPFRALTLLYL
jgi:hypothetical protein